ncbi:putative Tetratricopeptide repeat protein 1 [Glarea lozoyensis 74030]|uniref:Putative Tetratricopeptide repeat protein 1 n=1 Tax=Glarea lozoyensis (strain ATCC 74030 / MF5533) TaxID=1104152 RepID=H0ES06_GLAL7|nr:putative Tetratricopeptide repeat protein 1 [Glarea lozoyensis 74030]
MASRSEKFARKFPEKKDEDPQKSEGTKNDEEEIIKFSPEEEASATEALDGLERLEKQNAEKVEKLSKEEEEEIEVVMSDATRERLSKIPVEKPEPEQKRLADIERIKAKALMRRAKARSEQGADKRIVQQQLKALPPRTKAAQEKETGEMMDKLKQLGNGILKPFGLSTNNFQMVKDEKTGGYSMNFNQGA